MDIGRVGWHDDHDHDDYEIYTRCYNCGGWGHMSRECPSEKKGKGKGKDFGKSGKDFGKGGEDYGKGSKDSGKGGKDSGKGYQGACFNCGKVGHKAWECRSRRQVGAVDEENYGNDEGEVQAGAVEIGTIWNIGGVEINKVQKMEVENDPKTKAIEITVDSGAGASCWPGKLLKKIPMKQKDKGVRFKAANGTEIKYYGTKNITFQSEGDLRHEVPRHRHDEALGTSGRVCEDGEPRSVGGRPGQVVHRERGDRQEDPPPGMPRRCGDFQQAGISIGANPVRPGTSEGKIQVQGVEDDQIEIEAEVCEEIRVPKKMQNPILPGKAEREMHELTHVPFRSWCEHCVRGRGEGVRHEAGKEMPEQTEVHMDFFFVGDEDQNEKLAVLAARERTTRMTMPTVAPSKGERQFLARRVQAFLREMGADTGDITLKSEGAGGEGPSS